jgi:hypothetical protein
MLIFGLVGAVAAPSMGQNAAVLSVNVAAHEGNPIDVVLDPGGDWSINPASQFVQASPGDDLTLEVFVRCWSDANGRTMMGLQATINYSTYFGTGTGNVLPKDFGLTSDPNGLCPGNPLGTPNTSNAFVFPFRPDYVFAGFGSIPGANTSGCDYGLVAALQEEGVSVIGVCPTIPPKYFATLNVEVSNDASGLFQVCIDPNPEVTKLRHRTAANQIVSILPLEFECAWIQVGACNDDAFCDNGKFCDGVETCDGGVCVAGTPPCQGGCDEVNDACACGDACELDEDCDDGLFCNGIETCDFGGEAQCCVPGENPCGTGESCDEGADECVCGTSACDFDEDCDDGLFCNGAETCDLGGGLQCCVAGGGDPCEEGQTCDEELGDCVAAPTCDLTILDSTPPDGAIDARQPSNLDGTNPQGWSSVDLLFDGAADCVEAGFFSVSVVPDDVAAPSVIGVAPSGNSATITLSDRIPEGHWTKIMYDDSSRAQSSICLGYRPADVSGDGTSNAQDIIRLIDCLNGIAVCAIYQGDVDRSGVSLPADIIRVIDLLNGADEYEVANFATIGASPCP